MGLTGVRVRRAAEAEQLELLIALLSLARAETRGEGVVRERAAFDDALVRVEGRGRSALQGTR